MRPRALAVSTTLVLTVALANAQYQYTPKQTPPEAPAGWVALENNYWLPLVYEPGSFFHRAHEEFLGKDYGLAAIDLRQAAAYVRLDARRADYSEHAHALYTAANRLTSLAREVEDKAITSVARLDREFARTHCALAEHDYALAQEGWEAKKPVVAGENISAAVFNLKSAFGWAHQDPGPESFQASADATALADELTAGKTPRDYEFTTAMNAVSNTLRTLRADVNQLPPDAEEPGEPPVATAPPFVPGWTLVREGPWLGMPGDGGRHLHDMYEAYLQRHAERGARELHAAIFDLEMAAGSASSADKTALMNSIRGLEGLLDTRDGALLDLTLPSDRYEQAIAHACYTLGEHYGGVAERDWTAGKSMRAGLDLRRAADYLTRGRVWAGQMQDARLQRDQREASNLSDELIAGTVQDKQAVGAKINALATDLTQLRKDAVAMLNH